MVNAYISKGFFPDGRECWIVSQTNGDPLNSSPGPRYFNSKDEAEKYCDEVREMES